MTQKSYGWTTSAAGDGATTYTRVDKQHWDNILAACGGGINGAAPGYLNKLGMLSTAANQVTIDTGGAIVDGKPYRNDASVAITIPSAVGGGNTRIDTIALECDWTAQTVRLVRVAGVDAGSPTPPSLTQTSGTLYQIRLWDVTVNTSGTITVTTDSRAWARFSWLDTGTTGKVLKRKSTDVNGVEWGYQTSPLVTGRLSLSSTLPDPSADITAAANLYLLQYQGNVLELWDGTDWIPFLIPDAGVSLSLASIASGTLYDAFAYNNSGAIGLELLAWSSATARATALALNNGRITKSGDKTRRYLGQLRGSASGQCEDSVVKRFLTNYYNTVRKYMFRSYSPGNHGYTTGTWRWWNNVAASASVEFVSGYDGGTSPISAPNLSVQGQFENSAPQNGAAIGIWNGTSLIGNFSEQATARNLIAVSGILHPTIGTWDFRGYQQVGGAEFGVASANFGSMNVEILIDG